MNRIASPKAVIYIYKEKSNSHEGVLWLACSHPVQQIVGSSPRSGQTKDY